MGIKSQVIINQMYEIANTVKAEDLVGVRMASEQTEYTETRTKSFKKKHFSAPAEYGAIEALIDLRASLAAGDFKEAFQPYVYLKRLLAY